MKGLSAVRKLQQRVLLAGVNQPERVKSLLAVWGGNSANLAGLAPAISEEFGLPQATELLGTLSSPQTGSVPTPRPQSGGVPTPQPQSGGVPTPQPQSGGVLTPPLLESSESPAIQEWKAVLEKWNQGYKLEQDKAREIRKWLLEALIARIDWSSELIQVSFKADTRTQGRIHLPGVLVGNQSNPLVTLRSHT